MRMSSLDPTQPLSSWKKAWRTLTTKAGLPGLRFHDLRHHLITELCESGASQQTMKSMAGHVSQRMLDRYSHIRLDAKRQALEALAQGSHVTSSDTKSGHSQPLSLQLTDSNGRRVRI